MAHLCVMPYSVSSINDILLKCEFVTQSLIFSLSIRALFGVDKIQNAVHGSSAKEKADNLIKEMFGT